MDLWLIFAALAALSFALTNIVDKLIVQKFESIPQVVANMGGVLSAFTGAIILLVNGLLFNPPSEIWWLILAGMLNQVAVFFYFKALASEDVSKAIPVFYLSPIIVLTLAYFLFNETHSQIVYLGVLVLVIGSIMLSVDYTKRFYFRKAFGFMLISATLYAFAALLEKYLLNSVPFIEALGWIFVGIGLMTIPMMFMYKKDHASLGARPSVKLLSLSFLAELLNLSAYFFFLRALTYGQVSLVNAALSIQVLFVFIIVEILGYVFPKYYKEKLSAYAILAKLLSAMLILIGMLMISS